MLGFRQRLGSSGRPCPTCQPWSGIELCVLSIQAARGTQEHRDVFYCVGQVPLLLLFTRLQWLPQIPLTTFGLNVCVSPAFSHLLKT